MTLTHTAWRVLKPVPLGKELYSLAMCLRVPYFGTVRPVIHELRPGRCVVHARKRRAVHNHLGTFHAIACCNVAEVAAGMMTDVSIPATHRWIPRGMTVEYVAKARTSVHGIAEVLPLPDFGDEPVDFVVPVDVRDTEGTTVVRARITMRVGPA